MKTNVSFVLENYKVDIVASNQEASYELESIRPSIHSLSNPRELLSSIESVVGVESTIIKDINTDEIIISSGLLTPEEN